MRSLCAVVAFLALVSSACAAESTTTLVGSDAVSDSAPTDPSPTETAASCAFFDTELVPELQRGLDAVLSGVVHDGIGSDPCVHRFTAGDAWIELAFRAPDDLLTLFGDDALMTNGVDTTRAVRVDGSRVDVIAQASSPQSISTWDASLVGASVAAGSS